MRTELIARIAQLEAIADEWNALALPSPMQSPDWLIPWWQIYGGANRELAVVTIRGDDGCLLGLCPWYVEARRTGHCLRWLGDGAVCSDHPGILLARGASDEIIPAILNWLGHCEENRWSRLALESVDADDALLQAVFAGMHQLGYLVTEREEAGSAWIQLPSTWDEYLTTLSKNHRKRCRRWQRDFLETGRAYVQVATDPAECIEAFEHLVRLHNQRRRSAGHRGAFGDADVHSFHQLAIPRLARRGSLQLRLLTVDHQLAAVEYVLVDAATVYAYQSGLSAAGEAVSAGSLSILSLIRDAMDHGCCRVDLLRGTEPYKFSWGASHRAARTKVLRRGSVTAWFQSCLDNAVQRARRWKNSTDRSGLRTDQRAKNGFPARHVECARQ